MRNRYRVEVPKNVQIRNLDDATYEELRRRSAQADLSLSQYLRRELALLASTPTMAAWLDEADRWRAKHGGISRKDLDQAVTEMRADRDRLRD
jgi:plasmid stability protein